MEELKKTVPYYVGIAIAVVVIVGVRQFWEVRQNNIAEENAVVFTQAAELQAEDPSAALASFDNIIENGPNGYAALSAMRAASIVEAAGDRASAIRYLLGIAENNQHPQRLRDLARVKAGYMSLEDGRDEAMIVLNGMEAQETAFANFAKEIAGLAALDAEDYQSALGYFEAIEANPTASSRMKLRAGDFSALAHLGTEGKTLKVVDSISTDGLLDLLENVQATEEVMPTSNEIDTEDNATNQ